MNKDLMFSSATCEWATPPELFKALDAEFGFTCDVCATADNAKCKEFYPPEQDGLAQEWSGVCWCNPPYGREIGKWVRKAAESRCTVVMLLPARTDTKWFHDYIYGKAEIRFLKGRLKFGAAKNSAPFPSMVVVFKRESEEGYMAEYIERETLLERAEYDNNYRLIIPAEAIKAAPAADVAPVVHGRWVPFRSQAAGDIWYCSACEIGFAARMNYCPNCGAKMDLEAGG